MNNKFLEGICFMSATICMVIMILSMVLFNHFILMILAGLVGILACVIGGRANEIKI